MATCVMISPRASPDKPILCESNISLLKKTSCTDALIFSSSSKDGSEQLSSELINIGFDNVKKVKLTPLSTNNVNCISELKAIPWNILKEMYLEIKDLKNPCFILGRGTRLNDPLLWLAAKSVDAQTLHLDSIEDSPNNSIIETPITTQIAKDTLASILMLKSNAFVNDNFETMCFGADEIASIGLVLPDGVNSATQIAISNGLLEKEKAKDRVVYKLTSKGWPIAIQYWIENRNKQDIRKRLLIAFGRVPNNEGGNAPFTMLQYLSVLKPFDGLIAILQRNDNKIIETNVNTIDEAVAKYQDSSFIDELKMRNEKIAQLGEELINLGEHIFILNPKVSNETELMFYEVLWKSLMKYEEEYGPHVWSFDITGPLKEISPILSKTAYPNDFALSYVMKNKKGVGPSNTDIEDSPFDRSAHKLDVPNRITIEAIGGLKNAQKRYLIAMLLYNEKIQNEKQSIDEEIPLTENILSILADNNTENKKVYDGVSWKEINDFIKASLSQLEFSLSNTPSTRVTTPLINLGYIEQMENGDSAGGKRFQLTSNGQFVATWLNNQGGDNS